MNQAHQHDSASASNSSNKAHQASNSSNSNKPRPVASPRAHRHRRQQDRRSDQKFPWLGLESSPWCATAAPLGPQGISILYFFHFFSISSYGALSLSLSFSLNWNEILSLFLFVSMFNCLYFITYILTLLICEFVILCIVNFVCCECFISLMFCVMLIGSCDSYLLSGVG